MELYVIVQGVIGYLMSLTYESIAGNWHAHKIKMWIFVIACLAMGTWGALLEGTLKFTALSWSDPEMIFASVVALLQWVGIILGAGLASFKFFIHKKMS